MSAFLVITSACNQDNNRRSQALTVEDNGSTNGGSSGSGSGGTTSTTSSSSSSSGAGGNNFTCSLTLAINNGAASMGATAINANVGDQGNFNVTSNTGSNRFHWFGTKDGTPDLDTVVMNPTNFSGPFQDVAGGHTFTRYVIVENAAGQPLCDTRTGNANKVMTVTLPPGPTCSLSVSLNGGAASRGNPTITANVGDLADFTVATSAPAGSYNLHWFGTRDNVSDMDLIQNNGNAFDGNFQPDGGGHTFNRYIVVEKVGTNAPLCNTKTANAGQPMMVAINAGPTCSLTLEEGANAATRGPVAINSNTRLLTKWVVATNATAGTYNIRWKGTRDNVADLDMINNTAGVFDGPFPDTAGGHSFTRYITIEKASNGVLLCDSRTANVNKPITVNISAVPGCSIAVDKEPIDTSAGPTTATWSLTSVVANTKIFLTGTKNGATDVNDEFFDNMPGTTYSQALTYDSSQVAVYTRRAVIKTAATNKPVCQTNEVTTNVQ